MGKKNLDEAVDQGRRAFLRQSLLGAWRPACWLVAARLIFQLSMRSATKLYLKLQKTTPFPKKPIQGRAIQVSSRMTR